MGKVAKRKPIHLPLIYKHLKVVLSILSVLFALNSWAQPGTITVKKKVDDNNMYPKISGAMGGRIDPGFLCVKDGITVNPKITVISFDLSVIINGKYRTLSAEGNVLTSQMCSTVNNLPPGSFVYFENIFVEDEQGKMGKLEPMRFKIDPLDEY
jgi:hypothetical protein